MKLVLIRHAEAQRRGVEDHGLTELGRDQASRLADNLSASLETTDVAALYASPLPRAQQTAKAVSQALAHPIVTRHDLAEMGQLAGPDGFQEESLADFVSRVRTVLERLSADHKHDRVLVVTHAGFIVASLIELLGIPSEGDRARIEPRYASVTEWHLESGVWTLVSHNADAASNDSSRRRPAAR